MNSINDQFGALRDFVQACGVSFRLRPSYVSVAQGPLEAGFELELRGLHDCQFEHVLAGCAACRDLLFTLLDIADWVIPRGKSVCQSVTRYSHIFRECPETILIIKISCITTLEDIADGWIPGYAEHAISVLRQLGCRDLDAARERNDEYAGETNVEFSYLAANSPVGIIRRLV